MSNRSQVTAFSLNRNINNLLKRYQNKFHKSRSELLREMISFYVESSKKSPSTLPKGDYIDDSDVNKILKLYYQLISVSKPKTTLVIGVGIVNRKTKVVIGLRKAENKYVKNLHWTFPSGMLESLDFEKHIIKVVKEETGLSVRVVRLVHARLIPDSPQKTVRIVALYYHCKIISGTPKPGGDFKEIKWVPASEVNRYFTTSVSDETMNFLGTLN
jgi:ADP-ribose pyrophosphatase YjhB (NUDIX family)